MKRIRIILSFVFLFVLMFCIACNEDENPNENENDDLKLDIKETNIDLKVGEKFTFDTSDKILMVSNDSGIATVNENEKSITAVSSGTVNITIYLLEDTTISKVIKVNVSNKDHKHSYINGVCSCGEVDPYYSYENIYLSFELDKNEVLKYEDIVDIASKENVAVSNNQILELTDEGIKAVNSGNEVVYIYDNENEIKYNIAVKVFNDNPRIVVDSTLEVYLYETKEIKFDVKNGNKEDVKLFTSVDSLGLEANTVTPTEETYGTVYLQIGEDSSTKVAVAIIVLELDLVILNEDFELDLSEKDYKINYQYPKHIKSDVLYSVSDDTILRIDEKGVVEPLTTGKTSVIVSVDGYPSLRERIYLTVVCDPIKIIEALHIDNVLMKKNVKTVAQTTEYQDVYGSVSRYFFSDLNLISDIKPVNQNKYTGRKATKEILAEVEPLKKVRSGILLEELKYIIYHDTGNNAVGSDALMHSKFMVGTWNIENNRARSWHYTVDEDSVYHHLPDNEVAWQGDSYDAYAKSIGIETCIDYGSDLYTVWRRAGKLMASLIDKYKLSVNCIRQHYDMSGKDCPRTLRLSGLYSYAISLVEGELLFLRGLKDYNVTFESLTPEFLDNTGKIIKNPTQQVTVKYKVTITNDSGYNQAIELSSIVKPAV